MCCKFRSPSSCGAGTHCPAPGDPPAQIAGFWGRAKLITLRFITRTWPFTGSAVSPGRRFQLWRREVGLKNLVAGVPGPGNCNGVILLTCGVENSLQWFSKTLSANVLSLPRISKSLLLHSWAGPHRAELSASETEQLFIRKRPNSKCTVIRQYIVKGEGMGSLAAPASQAGEFGCEGVRQYYNIVI
jgi:hypothetical protein